MQSKNSTALRSLALLFAIVIVAYSATLMTFEYKFGQDYVRHYFRDLDGEVRFLAVNTISSAFLLCTNGVLFGLCWFLSEKDGTKARLYYGAQSLIFFFLGFDELYRVHESVGAAIRVPDGLIFLVPGSLFLGSLWFWGNLEKRPWRVKAYLFLASVFFALMLALDVFGPGKMFWRLSIEDLSKLWSDCWLLLYGFEVFLQHIDQIRARTVAA